MLNDFVVHERARGILLLRPIANVLSPPFLRHNQDTRRQIPFLILRISILCGNKHLLGVD